MHLEAHLTAHDFSHVLTQLTPLRISLGGNGDRRFVALSPPARVMMVESRGLRIVTDVQVQWDVIGIPVPVTMKRVSVLLTPSVVEQANQLVLAFGVKIEDADLSAIPSFLESVLLDQVNDALAKRESSIAWRFMETLDFTFRLPETTRPRYRVRLFAAKGTARVVRDTLILTVDWGLETHPHDSQPPPADDSDGSDGSLEAL